MTGNKRRKVTCVKDKCYLEPKAIPMTGSGMSRPFNDNLFYLIPFQPVKTEKKKKNLKKRAKKSKVQVMDGSGHEPVQNQVGGGYPLNVDNNYILPFRKVEKGRKKKRRNISMHGEGKRRRSRGKGSKKKTSKRKRSTKNKT